MLDSRVAAEDEIVGGAHVGQDDGQWREVDRQLRRIAKRRAGLDAEEARWLLAAERAEVHKRVGCVSFAEYVERILGYGPRVCADRLRVAEAIEELPAMRAALASGAVGYSTVREVTRVATAATEQAWIDAVRDKTAREVEELVTGHRTGDLPDDPTEPDLRPRTVRFELRPETFALYREAERRMAEEAGRVLTDDEVINAMCRAVLAPAGDGEDASNTPRYQVAITVCDECKRAWQDGAGKAVEIGRAAVATAQCDAQTIGRVDGNTRARASRTIPPALRRQVLRRDHHRCAVPGCRASRWIDVHHIHERAKGGANEADNLISLCSGHHRALHDGKLTLGREPAREVVDDADLRSALCGLGFKPAEAMAAIAHARAHVGKNPSLDDLLRAALRACRRPAS